MQENIDTQLKLVTGLPLHVKDFGDVKPLKLKNILSVGYTEYLRLLNIFCLKPNDLVKDPPNELITFDILVYLGDKEVLKALQDSLEFFLQEPVNILQEYHTVIVGEKEENFKILTRDNFDELCNVIKIQNYLNIGEIEETKTSNSKAKKIAERMKKAQEKVQKIKQRENEENESDFSDIISAICTKSNNINRLNVLDHTIYQIYDEFRRLSMIDNYEINIKAMMNGAKDVEMHHWSSKPK